MDTDTLTVLTPVWVVLVGVGGAAVFAVLQQLVLERRAAPAAMVTATLRTLRQPLTQPEHRDAWLFHLAPGLLLLAAVVALSFVPWAPGFRGIDLSTGAIAFPAALAYVTPAILMAGWGTGRPLAVLGGFRWVALMLAYAMPLAMVITAVAAPAGSLRPVDIVQVQHTVPMLLVQPVAFLLWLPAVMAVCFMAPFDLPQADSELGGGAFQSYTGLDRVLVDLAQKVLIVAVSGMTAALFLAGWHGPLLPGAVWMALKTAAVAALMVWLGTRAPRIDVEQALVAAWKVANPVALLAIVWAGFVTLVFYR